MTKMFNPFAVFDPAREEHGEVRFKPQPIATLYWASDLGPIRTIIDGKRTRPTGFIPSIKGGFRCMPWESQWEERAIQLADISSRVHVLLAQPHRLEIRVRGNRGRPLTYFPDLLLKVDPGFVEELRAGVRFIDAIRAPTSERLPEREWETLILEIKADLDPRDDKLEYRQKLEFANEVYERRGWHFFEIRESIHLKSPFLKTARILDWRKMVAIDEVDRQACRSAFASGPVITLRRLEGALGGGSFGRVKAIGLHYRQIVSIDLRDGLTDAATVYLVRGEIAR